MPWCTSIINPTPLQYSQLGSYLKDILMYPRQLCMHYIAHVTLPNDNTCVLLAAVWLREYGKFCTQWSCWAVVGLRNEEGDKSATMGWVVT